MGEQPTCRSCGAGLRFVRTTHGKAMPCNPVPDPTGNVAARRNERGVYVDAYVITASMPLSEGFTVFRPHWADCTMRPPGPAPKPNALF